jgi:molybdate-binding protein/DNA-binding PadR family transcriptional regulator
MARVHVLLGLLSRGERHGYALRRELEEEFGPEWRLDFGQLYRLIAIMRRKRWVRLRRAASASGPARALYTLTERGQAELARWLADPHAAGERGRDELPVKVQLGLARGRGASAGVIAERRRALVAASSAAGAAVERPGDPSRWVLRDRRRRMAEAALAALDSWEALVAVPGRARASEEREVVAVGSDDLVLDLLCRRMAERRSRVRFSTRPVGSLSGLIALAEGRAQVAGIHLLDIESGEYNLPFVKRLLPEEPLVLVNLAQREQGLLLPPGNPLGIRGLRDLTRRGIRLVNRQRGAGTRLLLFHRLRRARVDPHAITGYERELTTHGAVAAAVAAGTADVGPGLRAAAEAWGLEFLPLGYERYDLVMSRRVFESRRLRPLLELMHDGHFRRAAALPGYDLSSMGTVMARLQ